MKQILMLLALLNSVCLSIAQNPSRTVLYTCGVNEEFYCYEYYSNMKVLGNKFACITKNKVNSKKSFVLNGETVVSANDLDVFWIDLTSKNKCIYSYSKADDRNYLSVEGITYGPYEGIRYQQHACYFYRDGTPNLDLLYNKNLFYFKRMSKIFRHDNDGTIYECKGDGLWDAEEDNPVYKSTSGKHKAEFSMNYRLLNLDDVPYVMPIDVDADDNHTWLPKFAIDENGICIIRFGLQIERQYSYPWVIVHDNSIECFNDKQYLDFVSMTLKESGSHLTTNQPRQLESIMKWREGEWLNGIDISLQDKTNRHFFTANWNYDYVMIDDKKIGKSTPINAFYDENNNAFGWVTIEGRQLVLYSYKL